MLRGFCSLSLLLAQTPQSVPERISDKTLGVGGEVVGVAVVAERWSAEGHLYLGFRKCRRYAGHSGVVSAQTMQDHAFRQDPHDVQTQQHSLTCL